MVAYILLAAGLLCLVLFLVLRDKQSSAKAVIAKTFTSLFFLATAFAAFAENGVSGSLAVLVPACLVIMGLALGMVGDITLDFKIYFKSLVGKYEGAERDRDSMMYVGMACFGIGHVLYIAAMAMRFPGYEMNLLWSALAAVVFTALVFVISIKLLKMNFGKFFGPCLGYSVLLCWFMGLSASYVVTCGTSTSAIVLLVGSILFFVSDMVLSMTYFSKAEDYEKKGALNPESRLMISVNHVTYYAAQFLIALSLLFI